MTSKVAYWAYAENIVWALVFCAIVILCDGWAKAWAIVPTFMMNQVRYKRNNNEQPDA